MSEATIRYAASVVEKHELMKELKHWRLSTRTCIKEMQHSLRSLKDSEATSKREINHVRARLVEKLKILEERAERQLHDTVRAEEDRVESYIKALVVRQRRLDIAEARLKETSVGHRLKRWIEDGRSQIAIVKDALIGAKTCDLPSKLSFRIHDDLDPFLNGLSYLGILSLESDAKVINKIVGGTEDALAVRSEGDGSERTAKTTKKGSTSTASDLFERELRKQLGKGMKFTDDRYFKAILENHASKIVTQKRVDEKIAEKKFTTNTNTVTVTRLNRQSHQSRGPQQIRDSRQATARSRSAQHNKPKQSVDNRVVLSAREDSRTNMEEMHTAQLTQRTDKQLINVNDPRNLQTSDRHSSSGKLSEKKDKLGVRYLGYDFVKEITPFNRDSKIDLSEDSQDESSKDYEIPRPQSPMSLSNGSVSTISYTPSSSHASGPIHISPSTAKKAKSHFIYKAKFHTKKHPDDTDLCRLAGIATLNNGKVVVSDISHLQLMLFDDDMSYLYSLECPSPSGMCVVSSNIVAAALFHNRKVLLVKVHDLHMERFREILISSCPETLQGVSFCGDLYYVLCFKGDIHVMESDGRHSRMTRTISTHMKEGEVKHLETDPESNVILVSGFERVVCFSSEGKRLWQYTNDNPKRKLAPGGIVLYTDRIFVADWAGHRVIELSLTGTFVRSVILDNIEYPHGLSVNRQRGLMFVTQSNFFKQEARSRSIKVFQVK